MPRHLTRCLISKATAEGLPVRCEVHPRGWASRGGRGCGEAAWQAGRGPGPGISRGDHLSTTGRRTSRSWTFYTELCPQNSHAEVPF